MFEIDGIQLTHTVSIATVLALLGFLGTSVALVFRLGRRDQTITSDSEALKALGGTLNEVRTAQDGLKKDLDNRFASVAAQFQLIQQQSFERSEKNARTYATQETVRAIETRFDRGQAMVMERLEKVGDRVNEIADHLIAHRN